MAEENKQNTISVDVIKSTVFIETADGRCFMTDIDDAGAATMIATTASSLKPVIEIEPFEVKIKHKRKK